MTQRSRRAGERPAPARTTRARRRPLGVALAIIGLLLISAAGVIALPSAPARAANVPNTDVTVTVTPTTGVVDGTVLKVNVKTSAAYPVYSAEARVCRAGVDYQTSTGSFPAKDWDIGGANCPSIPITTSADLTVFDGATYTFAPTPEGETFSIRAGAGIIEWVDNGGTKRSLTCDAANPCALVTQIFGGPTPVWTPHVQPLTYRNDDPITACGGPAKDILNSGASDRMSEAWIAWTLGICAAKASPEPGAPSRATFAGEGLGVSGFDDRSLDLAYTAVGYDDAVNFLPQVDPANPTPRRGNVMVPTALNAVVLAVGNGTIGNNGRKVPYGDVKLTLDEAAALISGGNLAMNDHLPAIYARNPQLKATGFFNTGTTVQVAAASEAEAPSWFWGNHLKTLRPSAWRVPDNGSFGDERGKPRGADASFALADPSYKVSLSLFSGRLAFKKTLDQQWITDNYGGIWAVTDLATATALGLTVVQLENGTGQFVAPTPDNMRAAVAGMTKAADGHLMPQPSQTAGYPLTYVEYAMAPTEPLVDESTCTKRESSQAMLVAWLQYITGDGQRSVPPGLVALPAELAAQGASEIAKVGTAAVTGPCATQPTDPEAPPGAPTGDAGGFPEGSTDFSSLDVTDIPTSFDSDSLSAAGAGDLSTTSDGDLSTSETGAPGDAKKEDKTELASATSEIPGFGGQRAPNGLLALIALAGIVCLTSAAVLMTTGGVRRPGAR